MRGNQTTHYISIALAYYSWLSMCQVWYHLSQSSYAGTSLSVVIISCVLLNKCWIELRLNLLVHQPKKNKWKDLHFLKDKSDEGVGLATVRTWVLIQALTGPCCECELLAFILAPVAPTSRRLRIGWPRTQVEKNFLHQSWAIKLSGRQEKCLPSGHSPFSYCTTYHN